MLSPSPGTEPLGERHKQLIRDLSEVDGPPLPNPEKEHIVFICARKIQQHTPEAEGAALCVGRLAARAQELCWKGRALDWNPRQGTLPLSFETHPECCRWVLWRLGDSATQVVSAGQHCPAPGSQCPCLCLAKAPGPLSSAAPFSPSNRRGVLPATWGSPSPAAGFCLAHVD